MVETLKVELETDGPLPRAAEPATPWRRSGLWVPALLAGAGLAAYWRSFTVPFQFDDVHSLVESSSVHLTRLDWESLAPMLSRSRPLTALSFGLNYWLGGLAPAGWHAVNLAVHVTAATLAWLLAGELLARAAWGDQVRRRRVALIAALLFLLHPVQTQAVTYIVQRMASLAGCLALLATWLWFRGRRSARPAPWLAGAGGAWVAALLAKENVVLLPAIVAVADALLGGGFVLWVRRNRAAVLASGAAGVALGVAMVGRYWAVIQAEHARFGLSLGDRLLTQPRVLAHYLSLLAWPLPSRLRVDYDFTPSRGLLDPPVTLLALGGLVGLVAAAWWFRRRQPLASFAVVWFLGNLAVENTLLPVDLAFEHRLYLPSFAVLLLAAVGLEHALGARPARVWAVAAPAVLLLGAATDRRNAVWNDPAALHAQVLADSPTSTRALLAVGNGAGARGDLDGAERAYRGVLALEPANALAMCNLGSVARARGDLAQAEVWYRKALAIDRDDTVSLQGLGVVLAELGRTAEAEQQFRKMLAIDSRNARALADLGTLRARIDDRAAARAWFERAVEADPASVYVHLGRATALLAFGQPEDALSSAGKALEVEPDNAEALKLKSLSLEGLGRAPEAISAWRELLRVEPGNKLAAENLRRLGRGSP